MADTGHGATLTFGTTGGTWNCRSIGALDQNRPRVKTSYLGTSAVDSFMPGDLTELSEVEAEIIYASTAGLPAIGSATETVTITYPISSGGNAASTVAAAGFITGTSYPELRTNELQIGKIRFSFAGAATFTAQT